LDSKGKLLCWYTQNVDGLEWRVPSMAIGDDAMALLSDGHTINKDVKIIPLQGDIK
jgi:NAD-dependent SIR2 family protein deacetylase